MTSAGSWGCWRPTTIRLSTAPGRPSPASTASTTWSLRCATPGWRWTSRSRVRRPRSRRPSTCRPTGSSRRPSPTCSATPARPGPGSWCATTRRAVVLEVTRQRRARRDRRLDRPTRSRARGHARAGVAARRRAGGRTTPEAGSGCWRPCRYDAAGSCWSTTRPSCGPASASSSRPADIAVVGEAADGVEAVVLAARPAARRGAHGRPHAVMDGIEATRRIRRPGASPRVLVLTTFDLDEYVYDALRAGASGFLLKDTPRRSWSRPSASSPRRGPARPLGDPPPHRGLRHAAAARRLATSGAVERPDAA